MVFFSEGRLLRLAPAFDQVAMLYAPAADGQVPDRPYGQPYATADTLDVWDEARGAAREFWQRASDDTRVSDGLRRLSAGNASVLAGAAARPLRGAARGN